jgi:hypothetical protein
LTVKGVLAFEERRFMAALPGDAAHRIAQLRLAAAQARPAA